MADRVSVSITLGGTLPAAQLKAFAQVIQSERLSTEWDGTPFERADLVADEPLKLMAHEVAGGMLDELEPFCVEHGLAFARWADAYPGGWRAERLVFTGIGEPVSYSADGEDHILIDRDTVDRLGTIEAIRAHFAAADFPVPPFRVG